MAKQSLSQMKQIPLLKVTDHILKNTFQVLRPMPPTTLETPVEFLDLVLVVLLAFVLYLLWSLSSSPSFASSSSAPSAKPASPSPPRRPPGDTSRVLSAMLAQGTSSARMAELDHCVCSLCVGMFLGTRHSGMSQSDAASAGREMWNRKMR